MKYYKLIVIFCLNLLFSNNIWGQRISQQNITVETAVESNVQYFKILLTISGNKSISFVSNTKIERIVDAYLSENICSVIFKSKDNLYIVSGQKINNVWSQDYRSIAFSHQASGIYYEEIISAKFIDAETVFLQKKIHGKHSTNNSDSSNVIFQKKEENEIFSVIRLTKNGLLEYSPTKSLGYKPDDGKGHRSNW